MAVVGGGLAGLSTARALRKKGHSVIVLEARNRVGGRTWTKSVRGVPVDVGGQWIGPQQKRIAALAKAVGVKTFPTYNTGLNVYDRLGALKTYTGAIPPAAPAAIGDIAVALNSLNRMAEEVPLAAPWTAPKAREWDSQTLETWKLANMTTDEGRLLLDLGVEAVFAGEPRDVSLLHVLFYIHSAGSFDNLINTAGGAQETRFVGGSQLVSRKVAAAARVARGAGLPGPADRAGPPRRALESERLDVHARFCVVTAPPALAARIEYEPGLPRPSRPAHAADADGLRAQGPRPLRQAVLARRRAHRPGHERHRPREGHLRQLAPHRRQGCAARLHRGRGGAALEPALAGQAARGGARPVRALVRARGGQPRAYVEQNWMEEAWSRGCYGAWAPPGVLLDYGRRCASRWAGSTGPAPRPPPSGAGTWTAP